MHPCVLSCFGTHSWYLSTRTHIHLVAVKFVSLITVTFSFQTLDWSSRITLWWSLFVHKVHDTSDGIRFLFSFFPFFFLFFFSFSFSVLSFLVDLLNSINSKLAKTACLAQLIAYQSGSGMFEHELGDWTLPLRSQFFFFLHLFIFDIFLHSSKSKFRRKCILRDDFVWEKTRISV